MKMNIILTTLVGCLAYIILASNASGYGRAGHDATGASGAGTGANGGCSCHGVSASLAVTVELDSAGVPVTNYHPGASYTIKISGTNNSTTATLPKFGFQVSCVQANANNAGGANTAGSASCVNAGTWGTLPASTRISTGTFPTSLVEQSAAITATSGTGGTGTNYVESIPWTAPAAGTGAVVIYGVLNAVNNNGSESGDLSNIAKTLYIYEFGHIATCN